MNQLNVDIKETDDNGNDKTAFKAVIKPMKCSSAALLPGVYSIIATLAFLQ